MSSINKLLAALLATLCMNGAGALAQPAPAVAPANASTQVRIVTFNIENWKDKFLANKFGRQLRQHPEWPEEFKTLIEAGRIQADEENWEIERVLKDPSVLPDILVFQEGCEQEDLNYFNTQFMGGYFEAVHVFPSNTDRGQNIGILCRPGFKVLEFKENYHNDPDPAGVNVLKTGKLFARGPAFAHIQAPDGSTFWVGTNHMKSKSGNSVEVTKWRNAEAVRTHEIIQELRKSDPEVVFLGDLNDELGYQEYELDAGGSAIDLLVGSGADALVLATKPLIDAGRYSYHGKRRGSHHSLIDNAIVTPEAASALKSVSLAKLPMAETASDHYPVVLVFEFAGK